MPIDYLINTECVEITSANPSRLALRQEIRTFPGAKLSEIVSASFQEIASELSSLRSSDPHLFAEVMKHAFVLIDFDTCSDLADEGNTQGFMSHQTFRVVKEGFGEAFWRSEATPYFVKMASYRADGLIAILLLVDQHLEGSWYHESTLKAYGHCSIKEERVGLERQGNGKCSYTYGPVQFK